MSVRFPTRYNTNQYIQLKSLVRIFFFVIIFETDAQDLPNCFTGDSYCFPCCKLKQAQYSFICTICLAPIKMKIDLKHTNTKR